MCQEVENVKARELTTFSKAEHKYINHHEIVYCLSKSYHPITRTSFVTQNTVGFWLSVILSALNINLAVNKNIAFCLQKIVALKCYRFDDKEARGDACGDYHHYLSAAVSHKQDLQEN